MYNTTTLVDAIKRNTLMPSSTRKFTDTDILAILNEQIQWLAQTELIVANEEYFTDQHSITLVASQDQYHLPEKASAWVIDRIYFVDTSGNETRLYRRTRANESVTGTSNSPEGFYLEGANFIVYPDMGTAPTGTIKIYYSRIINLLREVASCGLITAVATLGTDYVLSCDVAPLGLPTNNTDIINGKNPYEIIQSDVANTVAGTDVTVAIAGFDRAPVAGDWVAQTGYSPVPHFPSEFHPLLVQAGVVKLLAASGDAQNYQTATQELSAMLTTMRRVTENRSKGSPKKIVPRSYILNLQRR